MKYYMKQQVFSWTDKFYIKNEYGDDSYYVEGELFSWGHKLHVYDALGVEVAFIRQEVFTWKPRFYIEINGEVIAEIVKEITLFKPVYTLKGLPWQLVGDFWAHDYQLVSNDRLIMDLTKEWWTWGDSYCLDVIDPDNALYCLCVALAVDCVLEQQQNSHNH